MINKLYHANNAGVKINLIIRGICCLIPGVEGMSENITAISIVDKYLEHSRILVFCNNNNPLYFITSADWMPRNLDRRVEVTAPIYDEDIKKELQEMIDIQLIDSVKSRILNQTQDNPYKQKFDGEEVIQSQEELYFYYKNMILAPEESIPNNI